jgi:hypothetical protein
LLASSVVELTASNTSLLEIHGLLQHSGHVTVDETNWLFPTAATIILVMNNLLDESSNDSCHHGGSPEACSCQLFAVVSSSILVLAVLREEWCKEHASTEESTTC